MEKFEKMIECTVIGLSEKVDAYFKNGEYYNSKNLNLAISIYSALALKNNPNFLNEISLYNESSFISEIATKPVKLWFKNWNEDFINIIKKSNFYYLEELVYLRDGQIFEISEDCSDVYVDLEKDNLNAYEQRTFYNKIKEFTQEGYVKARLFVIKNPLISYKDYIEMKLDDVLSQIEFVYEKCSENSYVCKNCGWTMSFSGEQGSCCNPSCTKNNPKKAQLEKVQPNSFRLKKGVIKYISIPGKLEIEIEKYAKKNNCETELWCYKDAYDIGIKLSNGKYLAVDAKIYKNPYSLRNSIKNDNLGNLEFDEFYYVVPDENVKNKRDYCQICNEVLKDNVSCITFRELKKIIREANVL